MHNIEIKHCLRNRDLHIEVLSTEDVDFEDCTFAFYLLINGQKVAATEYSTSADALFSLPDNWGTVSVVAFARSSGGQKTIERFDLGFSLEGCGISKRYDAIIFGRYENQVKNGFRARSNSEAVRVEVPMRWRHADRNVMFALHAWRFLTAIWKEFVTTQNYELLDEGFAYIRDWHRFQTRSTNTQFLWYDMAVGLRAIHLAFVWDVLTRSRRSLSGPDFTMLKKMSRAHLRRLADPSCIGVANHAVWQMVGLRTLAVSSGLALTEEVDYANRVMARLLSEQFDANGVNTEDAPFYHGYNLSILRSVDPLLFPDLTSAIESTLSKGEEAIGWLTAPTGDYFRIGDTEGAPTIAVTKAAPDFLLALGDAEFHIKDYCSSGYQVINSVSTPDRENFAFMYHCPVGNVHGHADQLSFILFHRNREIFADAGKYSYDINTDRDYFLSDRAHNTLGLADVELSPALIFSSRKNLDALTVEAGHVAFSGRVEVAEKFHHRRSIRVAPGRSVEIVDDVENFTAKEIEIRFLFGVGIEVRCNNGVFNIFHSGTLLGVLRLDPEFIYSRHLKAMDHAAWISERYRERTAVECLQFRYRAHTKKITTQIDLR